jgi:hypothetical protein
MTDDLEHRPARGYSWPPFEVGNTVAVRHGAFSERKLAEVAEALRPELAGGLDGCPWIDPVDEAEVTDWLTSEALVRTLLGELATRRKDNGGRIADGDRWLLERIGSAQNKARAGRDRLLLNPLSRFRAGRDVAVSAGALEALAEQGRQARAERTNVDDCTLVQEPSGD